MRCLSVCLSLQQAEFIVYLLILHSADRPSETVHHDAFTEMMSLCLSVCLSLQQAEFIVYLLILHSAARPSETVHHDAFTEVIDVYLSVRYLADNVFRLPSPLLALSH